MRAGRDFGFVDARESRGHSPMRPNNTLRATRLVEVADASSCLEWVVMQVIMLIITVVNTQ